jgi:hypothetical protein
MVQPLVFPEVEVTPAQSHLFIKQKAMIRGLPENLREVPNDPERWRRWANAVAAYREKRRRECLRDGRQQQIEWERCRRDTAYFVTVWLPIFEVRTTDNKPPSWRPFILFPFQVQMIRWIEWVMSQDIEKGNGRSDGVVEKARDMGGTYIFCAVFVKHFLFDDVFVAGIVSKKFDDVDDVNNPGTIFYKIRSMLGAEDGVPPHLRLPAFLQPKGFLKDVHAPVGTGGIMNPEPGKTCFFVGETNTKLSGVSLRNTVRLNDEAARSDGFPSSWVNQQATTDHRFALSTASLQFGPAFYNMARTGEEGTFDLEKPAPAFLKLTWDLHPFHTPEWFAGQRARAASNDDPNEFTREYEINYFAERGAKVYPRFEGVKTEHCPYDPNGGPLYCWIDPGTRDPAAIVWCQGDLIRRTWNIVHAFEGKGGEDVMFYASILTGVYVSGERQYDYSEYDNIEEIMEFTVSLTQPVIYVGDPAGTQRGGRGDDSSTWYRELSMAAMQLGGRTVHVQTMTANNARSYEERKQAVNALTPLLRFNDNRGGRRVLFCLAQSSYRKPQRQREALEPAKPEHGPESHIRSAVEFGCVWLRHQALAARNSQRGPRKPVRRSLSGNLVSGASRTMFDRSVRNGRRNGNPW